MPLSQIRSLTQFRHLLSETIEALKKSAAPASATNMTVPENLNSRTTSSPNSESTEKCTPDNVNRIVQFLSLIWSSTENRTESLQCDKPTETVKFAESSKTPESLPVKMKKTLKDFAEEQENELGKALTDWAESGESPLSKIAPRKSDVKSVDTMLKASKSLVKVTTTANIESRSRFLARSLLTATSPESQLLRLEDLCKHLLNHPVAKGAAVKELALKHVLHLRERSLDEEVQSLARETLTLLGHSDPPLASGIRILSIDGGGTRGMMAIEIIKQLEEQTGHKVHELFDFICGVSTGAILTLLFGGMRMNMEECERLYRQMSGLVFSQNAFLGTSRLVWSHAYYDTNIWENILRKTYGEGGITEVARNKHNPKIATVSAIMNQPLLQAYIFRSYSLPYRSHSHYLGGCNHKSWEAIRASAAAPGYFEEYCIDGLAHQDGGLMWNNPTALAIHEAQLLWPKERLACVVSLGTGRFVPPVPKVTTTSISLKTKMSKILDSATDTEGVHSMLHDLLPPNVYFRFNPYLTEPMTMDEVRPDKLQQLKLDAQMYLRKNEHKLIHAAAALTKPRSKMQCLNDWLSLQSMMRFG